MQILLILIHVFVCIVLIFVVLLQSGKAADLAGAFGGGGSQTALGSRGAVTVLAKATSICAILFMLTSLGLALYGSRGATSSVINSTTAPAPAAPAAPPAQDGGAPAPAPGDGGAAPAGTAPAEGGAPAGQQPAGQPPPGGGGN